MRLRSQLQSPINRYLPLQDHLRPKPLQIPERFNFYMGNKHEREGILFYVADLRKLATYCELGGNLNEMLRDRLVCRLLNMQIQKQLLSEANL